MPSLERGQPSGKARMFTYIYKYVWSMGLGGDQSLPVATFRAAGLYGTLALNAQA